MLILVIMSHLEATAPIENPWSSSHHQPMSWCVLPIKIEVLKNLFSVSLAEQLTPRYMIASPDCISPHAGLFLLFKSSLLNLIIHADGEMY